MAIVQCRGKGGEKGGREGERLGGERGRRQESYVITSTYLFHPLLSSASLESDS